MHPVPSLVATNAAPLPWRANPQFIAHRLGLIPLLSHKAREMQFPYMVDDSDADAVTGVTLTLHARCVGDEPVLVTSDDLVSEDPSVLPVGHPLARSGDEDEDGARGILIVKLRKGQELKVTCTARKARPRGWLWSGGGGVAACAALVCRADRVRVRAAGDWEGPRQVEPRGNRGVPLPAARDAARGRAPAPSALARAQASARRLTRALRTPQTSSDA